MSAETIDVRAVLTAKDEASPAVRAVEESLAALERRFRSLGAAFNKGIGRELTRQFDELAARTKALGAGMSDASDRTVKALRADTTAALAYRDALREVAQAEDAVARAARGSAGGNRPPRGPSGGSNGNGRGRGQGAGANDLRGIRDRWRIREASEKAEASAAAAQLRAQHDAFAQRLRDQRYLIGVRERSEAAEMRHLAGVRREHEAMRRRASTAGRHAYGHARHAVRSINHPALASPGHAAALGAAFGIGAAEHILKASEDFDTSMSRLKMFAPGLDADAIRRQALSDSISLGVSADKIVDSISKSVRDGVPPAIAESLPKSIAQTAQVMGGDIERLTDSLAEGIQEATSMGWIKDKTDARRFLNLEAGLSTTAGNTSAKTEQFIAAGGLGHGREMGLDLEKTMAFGAMLNSSGARTGQASARFMGQLSQNVPKLYDFYTSAVRSHKNSEEERAVKSAPARLGYAGIRDMQSKIMAGPEGALDFAVRLDKLDEKTRKLILQGYHFSEQGGAMLAELGSNGGAKGKAVLARAHELAEQKESNDYLTQKFAEWSKSLAFMIQQMTAGWHAIENEIGDVLKADIIAPFRDWWVALSKAIVGGNLRERVHGALMGFVHGLGFEDVAALLNTMSANARGFDVAGFAQGLGEGIRATVDSFRSMAGIFGGAGGLDARTIGRLAAELFGLSLALHIMAPFVTLIGGIASGFLAVKAALEGAAMLARLTGLADGIKAVVGAEAAAAGAGLLSLAGGLTVIGVAIQGLLSAGILPKVTLLPKDTTAEGLDDWLWGKKADGTSARPAWVDRLTGGGAKPGEGFTTGPHGGLMPLPQSYQGGGSNWRDLLTPASYSSDDETIGDRDRDTAAMIGTSRAAQRIADTLDKIVTKGGMVSTMSSLSTVAGFGGGGGEGGGRANMRYGRGVSGGWRSTPGTGSYGNPSKSLLDLIAKSEGAGYNVSWGNGRFLPGGHEQNLTGKTLNEILALGDVMRRQPGARNSSAMGRYQITGSTLRDLMRRMGLNGSEKYDEAMQDRLASKLISDEGPRALQRWEGLKRGSYMSQAQALLRSGSIASQPGVAAGGAGEAAGNLHLATRVLGEQCVDLAKAAVGATGSVTTWRKGVSAEVGSLVPGTPVATFLDRMGRESSRYAGGGTGTPGAHLDHAGIFQKYLLNGAGKRIGMQIAEQFAGSHGVHLKNYMFGQGFGEGNGSNYHAVLGPDGKPLGGSRNPLSGVAAPTVAGVTHAVPHPYGPNGRQPPAAGHGGAVTTAQAAPVHIANHFHGPVKDPRQHAREMMAEVETMHRHRYTDRSIG